MQGSSAGRSSTGRPFRDRADAGHRLAALLAERAGGEAGTIVLGLPRGGVPVAAVVAASLRRPLDLVVLDADRGRALRGRRPALDLQGRTVVVVDDGAATGESMAAAVATTRAQGAARVVAALPVASPAAVRRIGEVADEVVALVVRERFASVGLWYQDFRPTSDDEVRRCLSGDGRPEPSTST